MIHGAENKKIDQQYVAVIGIGFGNHHITLEAIDELSKVSAVLGHETLVSAVTEYIPDDALLISDSGILEGIEDMESLRVNRARKAVEYALKGKRVAYLCPGDPGVYGYAQPIIECAAGKVKVRVVPGITAALAAAADFGAPLRAGFALIGLYDDHVDFKIVEKRVKAAILSDFVIVFYLPKHEALLYPAFFPQKKYPHLHPLEIKCAARLENAFSHLLEVRSPQTPLGIWWVNEEKKIILTNLGNYKDVFEDIFPYSTVIIGSSQSECAGEYLISGTEGLRSI
jgi:precorrin-3B C17-methyltransferase